MVCKGACRACVLLTALLTPTISSSTSFHSSLSLLRSLQRYLVGFCTVLFGHRRDPRPCSLLQISIGQAVYVICLLSSRAESRRQLSHVSETCASVIDAESTNHNQSEDGCTNTKLSCDTGADGKTAAVDDHTGIGLPQTSGINGSSDPTQIAESAYFSSLDRAFGSLLQEPNVAVLGFAMAQDLHRVRQVCPNLLSSQSQTVIDLQQHLLVIQSKTQRSSGALTFGEAGINRFHVLLELYIVARTDALCY